MATTIITDEEFDSALIELAAEQEAWFKDAREKQQQHADELQAAISLRIAVAIKIGEYLEANADVTYRARASSIPAGLRNNFMRARPLHN